MVKILVVIGIIVGVIILILILLFVKDVRDYHIRGEEKIQVIADQYPEAVKKHLEEKYGEKFIINLKGVSDGGSPIPFSEDTSPIYYEVYAEDDLDFVFNVYVYPISEKDRNIKEIRDNYCWKFLREKLRKKMEEKLDETLPEGYKLLVRINGSATFENNVAPDSPIEEYFSSNRLKPRISISVFVLDNDSSEQEIKQRVSQLFNKFQEDNNNARIKFTYYIVKDKKEFDSIDIKNEEKKDFIVYETHYPEIFKSSIWSIEMEEKFEIKIDNDNRPK